MYMYMYMYINEMQMKCEHVDALHSMVKYYCVRIWEMHIENY